jgi:cytochrome d ubiquinol oxidase subunit II
VAQYPYLIIPDVTISSAAVPRSVLIAVTIASVAGMLVLLPSLWYLFRVFKGQSGNPAGRTAAARAEEGWRAAFGDNVEGTEAGKRETGDAE